MSKDIDGTYDAEGWQYAPDFKGNFVGREESGTYVRRRKWVRVQIRILSLAEQEKTKTTPL
jgi:hypothetical protein